jgi:hypothetical protein
MWVVNIARNYILYLEKGSCKLFENVAINLQGWTVSQSRRAQFHINRLLENLKAICLFLSARLNQFEPNYPS